MTSLHLTLMDQLRAVTEHYYNEVKMSNRNYTRDEARATQIQAYFRMFRFHKYYKRNRYAAITIQKYVRAFLARKVFMKRRTAIVNRENVRYFSFQASVIQRYYRGYIKRKYFHDFYARKQYLNFLRTKNEEFKQELEYNAIRERQEELTRQEQCAKAEFTKLASNLHHLASTTTQPGIYKPPYAPQPPKVFDIEVETHIKAAFRSNYQWKPPKSAFQRSTSASKNAGSFRIKSSLNRVK